MEKKDPSGSTGVPVASGDHAYILNYHHYKTLCLASSWTNIQFLVRSGVTVQKKLVLGYDTESAWAQYGWKRADSVS